MKNLSQFIYILFNVCCMFFIINCEEEAYFENVSDSEDLIDPHSFFYDKHNKRMIKESGDNIKTEDTSEKIMSENKDTKECNCVSQVNNCENHEIVFYKRLINLLLANINIKEEDDISLVGVLEIEISHAQMKILQDFHPQKISLRKVDEILSHVIKKPQYIFGVTYFFDSLLNKFEMAFKIIQDHPDGAIIVFLILMMGLMLRMLKQNRRFPLFIMIQIIFVSSFFMTWWQLVQEAEIKAVAQQMKFANVPISCQPDKMTMWDKFVSFVTSNEDCEKYYEAMMSNPKLKITPAHALSHFITTVILHPVTHIGTVISVFINNATDGLSWTYAWIIKFMLFLCVAVVIIMIPMCLSGAALNFGIGPLLRFGIDYKKRDRKGATGYECTSRDRCTSHRAIEPNRND
ncbi:uncharacterized protein LOC116430831 isoform X2 [Nomia melanderi]|uniref:uncharacterized protein LOC116430831 isoform X2 n=1 Tax=Nomia melanderi TaxID=2448451 RepID=UPI0013041AFA|nr:chloride channel CLIC-like protein 1 isoform X2 [Nomia melanderi]